MKKKIDSIKKIFLNNNNNNIYIFPPKSNSNEENKNKNFIPGQKQFKNLKRTFLAGQMVVSKKKKAGQKVM